MQLTDVALSSEIPRPTAGATAHTQRVLIVNGDPESLGFLEAIVEAGHYDVVFVESVATAYSQVKKLLPDLVILCAHIDDVESLQVLSMLRLDAETRWIPVLTYTTDARPEEDESISEESASVPMFLPRSASLMN